VGKVATIALLVVQVVLSLWSLGSSWLLRLLPKAVPYLMWLSDPILQVVQLVMLAVTICFVIFQD